MADPITYIDRQTGEKKQEAVYGEWALRFLYGTKVGSWIAKLFAHVPLLSHLYGWWQASLLSRHKIAPFIEKYQLDTSEFKREASSFTSFNDFFTRKLKTEARLLQKGLIAPADGRYLFFQNIEECDGFVVKNKKFSLDKLLNDHTLAEKYRTGSMLIARLCPTDYHRFHFPCDCTPSPAELINGLLFSVNPIALKKHVELLAENKRVRTFLQTENYGTIIALEIGATNVGTIRQTYTPNHPYKKGDEKGFFSFGGSCIILLFEPNQIKFEQSLLDSTSQNLETLCLMGQSLEFKI